MSWDEFSEQDRAAVLLVMNQARQLWDRDEEMIIRWKSHHSKLYRKEDEKHARQMSMCWAAAIERLQGVS